MKRYRPTVQEIELLMAVALKTVPTDLVSAGVVGPVHTGRDQPGQVAVQPGLLRRSQPLAAAAAVQRPVAVAGHSPSRSTPPARSVARSGYQMSSP